MFTLRPFHCCLPYCRLKIFCGEIFKRKSNSWHHSDAARCPCAGCAVHGNKIDLIDLSNSCSFGVDFIVEMERNLSSFFIETPKYKSLLFLLASAFVVKKCCCPQHFFETTLHFWQRLSEFFRCLFFLCSFISDASFFYDSLLLEAINIYVTGRYDSFV